MRIKNQFSRLAFLTLFGVGVTLEYNVPSLREECLLVLKVIGGSGCGNGPCPTVYETANGTILVQGFTVSGDSVELDIPPGESLVEIPRYVLERAMSAERPDDG